MTQVMTKPEAFLTSFRTRGHRVPSSETLRTYKNVLRQYLRFLNGRQPSPHAQELYLKATIRDHTNGYALVCQQATGAYHRFLDVPVAELRIDPTLPHKDYYEAETIEAAIASSMTPREYAVMTVLWCTGMRAAELLSIRWEDIKERPSRENVHRMFVKVHRKGGRTQDLALSPRAIEALVVYGIKQSGLVFPLPYNNLYHIVRRAGKRAGVKLSPHDLRHALASDMRRRGVSLDDIKEQLGHTDSKVTSMYYAHISPHDLADKLARSGAGGWED